MFVVCNARHKQPCKDCQLKVEVARYIVEHGFIQLSVAFKMVSPKVSYFAKNARIKLLQMPLAAISVGEKKMGTYCIYLVEKKDHTSYRVLQTLLNKTVP